MLPPVPTKIRDDFAIGRQLLEAAPATDYTLTAANIAISLISRAHHCRESDHGGLHMLPRLDSVREKTAIARVQSSFSRTREISRHDFSLAFDPIAASEKAPLLGSASLEPSVLDRTMAVVVLDVAPFVRGIVAYDHQLMLERVRRSNRLSEGGRPGKRMRNTRSAFSALEGGARSTTRRGNYFSATLNAHIVQGTGGAWGDAVREEVELARERQEVGRTVGPIDEDGTGTEE